MTNILKRLVNEALEGGSKVELGKISSKLDYSDRFKLLAVIELLLNELQQHQIITQKPKPTTTVFSKEPVIAVKAQTKATTPEKRPLDELWPHSESSPASVPITPDIVEDTTSVGSVQNGSTEPIKSIDGDTIDPFEAKSIFWPEVFQSCREKDSTVIKSARGWTSIVVKGRQY